jgi:hypothetical protein
MMQEEGESALVKSNYSQLPREAKKTADSTFDRIYKYYHNDKTRIELTDEEKQIRDRWEKAWLLLSRHRTQKAVCDLLERLFHISKSVAYDDIRKAMMLFSNPLDDLKEAKRSIAETMAMNGANKCWKEGNMDGYHKFVKLYMELNKLDIQEDDISGLLKKLKPTQVLIVASREDLQAEAAKIQAEIIHDVEYTEANEGEGSES